MCTFTFNIAVGTFLVAEDSRYVSETAVVDAASPSLCHPCLSIEVTATDDAHQVPELAPQFRIA